MERRPTAGEEHRCVLWQSPIADPLGHLREPLGLRGDRLPGQVSGHEACLYHRSRCPSSRGRRSETASASLTAPMPQVGSVACFIVLAAGSRYETPASKGIAHFAEHMFFKGTERRPTARSISTEIDAIGGEFNAFTGKELTGYYVRCATETRDVALDVLVDMLRNSRFDSDEIEKEKGVILEEMNVYLDTPQRYVGNVYDRLLFADQPLGWDILGTRETIEGATRDTFTSYLDAWYRPERIVVGDRRKDRRRSRRPARGARSATSSRTRPGRRRRSSSRPTGHRSPAHEAVRAGTSRPRRARVRARSSEALRAPAALGRPRRRHVLTSLHGGPRASRALVLRPCRQRLVHGRRDALHGRRSGRDRIDEAITTIIGELRKIAAEPVPADELEKARGYSKGRFVLRLESPQATDPVRAEARGARERDRGARRASSASSTRVTAEDVQDVARDLLEGKRLYLAVVGPFDDPGALRAAPRRLDSPSRERRARAAAADGRDRGRLPRHARRTADLAAATT